jgi:hypothetical protein
MSDEKVTKVFDPSEGATMTTQPAQPNPAGVRLVLAAVAIGVAGMLWMGVSYLNWRQERGERSAQLIRDSETHWKHVAQFSRDPEDFQRNKAEVEALVRNGMSLEDAVLAVKLAPKK